MSKAEESARFRVLMVGDISGSAGRFAFARVVGRLKEQRRADFVVANAENAAGGRGITGEIAAELFKAGADALTLGDHVWDQKGTEALLASEPRLVRPANLPPGTPGGGWSTIPSPWGAVTVICLLGRTFMKPNDCPFRTADALLERRAELGRIVLVDLHAEATSEKVVMGRYLDGRVTAVAGTHTHVQTSDETIWPGGTAYITDLGMTGARESALGRDLGQVTRMFLTGRHTGFEVAKGDPAMEGLLIEVDYRDGRAKAVERIRERP
jgi:metallophosphoesterase (TIGR00282 family)